MENAYFRRFFCFCREEFAQGMLQTPSVSNSNGEYKALGLNMAYERPNDGNQWYKTNPNDLTSREEIDR